jgi:hypothetical protein
LRPIRTTTKARKRIRTITVPSVAIVTHTELRSGVGAKLGPNYAMRVVYTRGFAAKTGHCH